MPATKSLTHPAPPGNTPLTTPDPIAGQFNADIDWAMTRIVARAGIAGRYEASLIFSALVDLIHLTPPPELAIDSDYDTPQELTQTIERLEAHLDAARAVHARADYADLARQISARLAELAILAMAVKEAELGDLVSEALHYEHDTRLDWAGILATYDLKPDERVSIRSHLWDRDDITASAQIDTFRAFYNALLGGVLWL